MLVLLESSASRFLFTKCTLEEDWADIVDPVMLFERVPGGVGI